MGYLYYPGCALKGTAIDYDESFQSVAPMLGIDFTELKEWGCCGATAAKSVSQDLAESLPLRALASADQAQKDLLTLCPSCHINHRQAAMRLREGAALAERPSLQRIPEVKQLLEVLATDVGTEKIKERIVRSLEGIRIVPYYGCLVTRPFPFGEKKSMENPGSMESLIEATGAQPVFFPYRTDCCGGGIFLSKQRVAIKLSATILKEAKNCHPIALWWPAPCAISCWMPSSASLSGNQGRKWGFRVLYITQLLGIAMGIEQKKLGLHRLITSPRDFMQKIKFHT